MMAPTPRPIPEVVAPHAALPIARRTIDMDRMTDGDRHDVGIVRLLTGVVLAVPRLVVLRGLALTYDVAPATLFAWGRATDASSTGGADATSGRRFPTRVAGRWAATWVASLAVFSAVRTVARAQFVGLLRWIGDVAAALPAHPTFAQTLGALPATGALLILPLVVIVVVAGPVLVPVIAAGHIAVSWLRGGAR